MFIRKTSTGRGDGGERYATYRLVHNERIGGKVTASSISISAPPSPCLRA